jgi:hypothetical protein
MAIRLNEGNWWKDDMERTNTLRPLIPLLLDSKQPREKTLNRIYLVADNSVRVLTPMRLRFRAEQTQDEKRKASMLEGALKLESLQSLTDKASALAAREVCLKFKKYAYADAYSDAYAAAYAAAYADADADADAAACASAYADADADAQRVKYRDALLALFHQVAAIKD